MAIVRVAGTGVAVASQPGEPILATLIRTGYSYRFGCKRGGCGVCTLTIVDGAVTYPVTVADDVLPHAERERTVLSCRGVPCTDEITVQMPPDSLFRSTAPFLNALMQVQGEPPA